MSEQPAAGRDVLSELDSIRDYLLGLIGEEPLPGQESNRRDLVSRMAHLRVVAQNVVELSAEYSSGVTHEQRVQNSMGVQPSAEDYAKLQADHQALLARMAGNI